MQLYIKLDQDGRDMGQLKFKEIFDRKDVAKFQLEWVLSIWKNLVHFDNSLNKA